MRISISAWKEISVAAARMCVFAPRSTRPRKTWGDIMNASTPSRRSFLRGAAASLGMFALGSWLPPFGRAMAQGPAAGPFDPNIFLQIAADNTVTLISKHFEMGQGITTGLATLVAEELGADWDQMRFVFAPANPLLYH